MYPKANAWVVGPYFFSLALFSEFSLCFYNARKFCVVLVDDVAHRQRETQRQTISEIRKR